MDREKDIGTLARAVKHYYDRDIHNTRPKFMVLEHMELGIVAKWIGKSSKQNTPWPDRMLWLMFECCKIIPSLMSTLTLLTSFSFARSGAGSRWHGVS